MAAAEAVAIELPGPVRGKGRPRFARVGPHIRTFTDAATRSYEGDLRAVAIDAMGGRPPMDGPVMVRLIAVFSVPVSWSGRRQKAALAGTIRPIIRPDVDNILKLTDALNGIVWRDDKQVVSAALRKVYGERPGLHITVIPIVPAADRPAIGDRNDLFADGVASGLAEYEEGLRACRERGIKDPFRKREAAP